MIINYQSRMVDIILDQEPEDVVLGLASQLISCGFGSGGTIPHGPRPLALDNGLDLSDPTSACQLTGFEIPCTCQSALSSSPVIPLTLSPQGLSQLFRMNEFGRQGLAG